MQGQTLHILWVFLFCREFLPPRIHPTTRWLDYKSNHTIAPSHSGFFLFYYYNLQGSCVRTVIQPLVETAGLLISWVFPFLPRTIPTSTDQQGGVSFQTTPMGKITHTHSPRLGLSPQQHTYGSESVPIVQGLVYDLNVYKTHGEWLSQWNLTTWDAFKMQWVFPFLPRPTDEYLRVLQQWTFSFLPRPTNKYLRVLHTRV